MDIKSIKERFDFKRIALSFAGVTGMGFFVSILINCNLGTDPCTFMNRSICAAIGMTFGNWQLIANIIMFIVVSALVFVMLKVENLYGRDVEG